MYVQLEGTRRRLLQLVVFQSHAKVFMDTDIYGGVALKFILII